MKEGGRNIASKNLSYKDSLNRFCKDFCRAFSELHDELVMGENVRVSQGFRFGFIGL